MQSLEKLPNAQRNTKMMKPDASPLLSLVVPTKNRQEYAISLLQGVRACEAPELEVIVQDNSDDTTLQELVSGLNDPRIRYFHCAEPLNMHQNFDLAINKARGEYVCAMGDDDGIIIPAALASLHRAKSRGADALLTEMYSYSWPGIVHRIWGDMGGPVSSARVFPGIREQLLDPVVALEELFRRGSVGGLGLLPRIYHGYVSRTSLNALKEHCGTYFPGSSPDLANAVALVPFVDTMLFDPSVTLISGHSPRSGGGQGTAGQHHGELEDVSHLPPETLNNWDPAIPRFWSGTTIYAQSAVEAARAVDLSPAQTFNYKAVCVGCLIYQPTKYRKHIRAALLATGQGGSYLGPSLAAGYVAMTFRRSKSFIRNFAIYYLGIGILGRFDSIKDIMIQMSRGSDTS